MARAYLWSELERDYSGDACRYCESVDRPSTLTMHAYGHPGGVPVIQHGGVISPLWVYWTCSGCSHQWSLQKLSNRQAVA